MNYDYEYLVNQSFEEGIRLASFA